MGHFKPGEYVKHRTIKTESGPIRGIIVNKNRRIGRDDDFMFQLEELFWFIEEGPNKGTLIYDQAYNSSLESLGAIYPLFRES